MTRPIPRFCRHETPVSGRLNTRFHDVAVAAADITGKY